LYSVSSSKVLLLTCAMFPLSFTVMYIARHNSHKSSLRALWFSQKLPRKNQLDSSSASCITPSLCNMCQSFFIPISWVAQEVSHLSYIIPRCSCPLFFLGFTLTWCCPFFELYLWSLPWLRDGLLDGCKMLFAQRLEILLFLVAYQNYNFLCSGHQICSLFYGL
jgi:hypothetical protein